MFFGIYLPNFGAETTPRLIADLVSEAEEVRCDGAFPLNSGGPFTQPPDTLREIRAYIDLHRQSQAPFDLVIIGSTPSDNPKAARKKLSVYQGSGLTLWMETLYRFRNSVDGMRQRIRQGPPRLEQ